MLRLEPYTKEEEQAINELKKRIINDLTPNLKKDETLYYRFLKARDFNIDNAEQMLRKHITARKFYQYDEIVKHYEIPEHIQTYFPDNFLGYDKEGSIVRYLDVGGADHRGITYSTDLNDVFRYMIHYIEDAVKLMTEQTIQRGYSVTQMVYILDMKGLDIVKATHQRSLKNFCDTFQFLQDNFPERIKALYVINAQYYFYLAFPIYKAVLASALLQKFHIFGKNGWKEFLTEKIDLECLPAFLGGKKTDPDGNPLCLSLIRRGRKVPENLYLKGRKSLRNQNDVETVLVKKSSYSEIPVTVDEANINLEWEFEAKSNEIFFGLLYKDDSKNNSQAKEIIPKHRVNTEIGPETGLYKCDKSGTYILVFDNSNSWIFSKEVYYRIRLTESDVIQSQ